MKCYETIRFIEEKCEEVDVHYEDEVDNPPVEKILFQLTVSIDILMKINNDLSRQTENLTKKSNLCFNQRIE
jgi:hypothetical protein